MSFLKADTDFPSDIFSLQQISGRSSDRISPFPPCTVRRMVGPGGDLGRLARLHRSALMPVPSVGGRGDPGALAGHLNHFGNACPGWSDPPSAGEPGSPGEFTDAGSGEDAVQSEEPPGPGTAFPGRWRPHHAGCGPPTAGRARLKPWRILGKMRGSVDCFLPAVVGQRDRGRGLRIGLQQGASAISTKLPRPSVSRHSRGSHLRQPPALG